MNKTQLTEQEETWILEQRVLRLTDNQETLIYPMGAERYLSSVLGGYTKQTCPIKDLTKGKDLLIIPGYGNTGFLFAEAGAKSVTVYDKDPITIAWVKAMKKYYHYREYSSQGRACPSVGELLSALTRWYPPLLPLPHGRLKYYLLWAFYPKGLRRAYIFYLLTVLQNAIRAKTGHAYELQKNMRFYAGEIEQVSQNTPHKTYHTAFIPYLLGVTNGIERPEQLVNFIHQLTLLVPNGHLLITPSQQAKEFNFTGANYFNTTGYNDLAHIPGLENYAMTSYSWFRNQGLLMISTEK